MRLIGLTGGIAAGKSTVARRFGEAGAIVIDADAVARAVVEPGEPALACIRERFGSTVIAADGSLDRAALGAIVFDDADARKDLEAITHPAVGRATRQRIADAVAADPNALVVYDVPLLVEAKVRMDFDAIVVVHAPEEERVRRLVELRGMSEPEALARVRAQASDAERLAVADYVVDASGTETQTLANADGVWAELSA